MPRRRNPLPKAVIRAHAASKRPMAAKVFILFCALAGGFAAALVAFALTSGKCAGGQIDCGAFSQLTLLYALFAVPVGATAGGLLGGSQFDRAARAYRPEM